MKKFFLFKRKEIDISSLEASDTGEGLDVLAISTDHLSFITASLGRINIVFNNATLYEENNLLDGESFKKTSVSVACEEGNEFALIESIMQFISSDLVSSNVMRFDAIQGNTNVREASIQSLKDVVSEVKTLPVRRVSKEASSKTFIGGTDGTAFGTGNVVGGIDFGDGNLPVIDFTEENIAGSPNLTSWTNGGSGGSTYNITTITGTVPVNTDGTRDGSGVATDCVEIRTGDNLELANTYTLSGPFTLFSVIGKTPVQIEDNSKTGFLFHGSSTSGQGLTYGYSDPYDNNNYYLKFATELGEFIKIPTTDPIIDVSSLSEDKRTTYVVVVRRDRNNNIFINTNDGAVGQAVANTKGKNGRTDGNLVIDGFGDDGNEKFQGNLARFGVIPKYLDASATANLIKNLIEKYKPTI